MTATPQTQYRRQSRAQLEAQDRLQLGDTRAIPGKRLEAGDLSELEFEVVKLRARESREVTVLAAAVSRVDCPLRGIVVRLVNAVDHLNCIIAGIAVPDTGGGTPGFGAPDFGGLTMGALRAKRACLCIAAKSALREALAGRVLDAEALLLAALDTCFAPVENA